MTFLGVDVSGANSTNINWARVHTAGYHFAVCKINEGDLIEKTTSRARIDAIRRVGMIPGGYDYVHPKPGRSGAQEFGLHYAAARHVGLYAPGDMRPVIDVEASSYDTATPAGRAHTIAYVRSWVQECFRVTGHHPIIYTGFFWRDHLIDPDDRMHCQLWYPSYPKLRSVPRAWGASNVTIHQFSETGTVPGIQGHVDLDRYLTDKTGPAARAAFIKEICL